MTKRRRRSLLAALGSAAAVALAGCTGGDEATGTASPTRTGRTQTRTGTATPTDAGTDTATRSAPAESTGEVNTNDLAWPSYGADPGNTGHSRVATAPPGAPGETWQFRPEDASFPELTYVPAVADGTVYAAGNPDDETLGVYALDPASGEARWSATDGTTGASRQAPASLAGVALDDGAVYAGDTAGVMAVERDGGAVRWTSDALLSLPTTVGDTLYGLGSAGGMDDLGVVGLDTASGDVATTWAASGFPLPAAFDGSRAYLLVSPADVERVDLVAVSLADEREAWRAAANDHGGVPFPRQPVVHRNTVVTATAPVDGAASAPRRIIALDATSGRERWGVTVGEDGDASVGGVVAAGGTVHVVERHRNALDAVRAYDLASGAVAWEQTFGRALGDGAVATAETLYVTGGGPVALSLADGSVQWRSDETALWPLAVGAGGFYRGSIGVTAYRG
jgi:hypothetical protein